MSKLFFVYGTLKVGSSFASQFDDLRKSSVAGCVAGFNLYDLGNFPGVVDGDGIVYGEVHEYAKTDVTKVTKMMDKIEGYHKDDEEHSLYLRRKVAVQIGDDDLVEASIYVFNRDMSGNTNRIKSGIWELSPRQMYM